MEMDLTPYIEQTEREFAHLRSIRAQSPFPHEEGYHHEKDEQILGKIQAREAFITLLKDIQAHPVYPPMQQELTRIRDWALVEKGPWSATYTSRIFYLRENRETWQMLVSRINLILKEDFIQSYPELARSEALCTLLKGKLSLPEIQSHVKWLVLHHRGNSETTDCFNEFLRVTFAPMWIERRYTGEMCKRIYMSVEELQALLVNQPDPIRQGISSPQRETKTTCICSGSAITAMASQWLLEKGYRVEDVRESEIRTKSS
jgi:hypothetical protein